MDTPLLDRTPPQDIDAERSTLGAMLINPAAVATAAEILGETRAGLFYVPAHQMVYNACLDLYRQSRPVDLVTVVTQLGQAGQLEAAGGASAVAELSGASPTSANVEHYARIVLDRYHARALIDACNVAIARAYESRSDADTLLNETEAEIFALAQHGGGASVHPVGALVGPAFDALEKRVRNREFVTGLRTGIDPLDKMLCGIQPGDMVILAARPSVGKTAFALNVAEHVARREGKGVLMFSLEMSKEQFTHRLLCLAGGIDMDRVRDGYLAQGEIPKAQEAAGALQDAPIWIDETVALTPLDLRARARRHAAQHKNLGLVVIDYMQLMTTRQRRENRQNEIAEISRSIKALARELRVPVMALSQLSREAEKNDRGIPMLSHLRESGSIEQDADVVLMLSKPSGDDPAAGHDVVVCHIAKQRNGPIGKVEMLFRKQTQQFRTLGHDAPPPSVGRPVRQRGPRHHPCTDGTEDDIPFT